MRLIISIGALALGVALASAPAFAQSNGPAGQNYGAGSSAQTGGTNYQPASPQIGQGLYNVVPQQQNGANGPAGQNYGAGSSAQTGGTNYQATSPQIGQRPLYNFVPQNQQQGPNGPGGANYGAGSNPQTGH